MRPAPAPPSPGDPGCGFRTAAAGTESGLHNGDDRAHFQVCPALVRPAWRPLSGLVVVVGVSLPPEGGEGFAGGGERPQGARTSSVICVAGSLARA